MLNDDGRVATGDADDLETDRRDPALRNVAGRDIEGLRCGLAFIAFGDRIDFDTQPGGQLTNGATPGDAEHAGGEEQRHLVERLAEAHHVEHHDGAVVGGVVGNLHAPHLLDSRAGGRERQRNQVGDKTGVHSVDIDARITLPPSFFE